MSWKRLIGYGYFIIFIVPFSILPYLVAQTSKMDENVRIVHNEGKGKWADNPHLSLKLIRVFGGINTKDENQIFNRIVDMVLDKQGNLYILDSRDCRIQKFSPGGEFQKTIGRKGQGPGEFNRPSFFDIDTQGNIYVMDSFKCKILTPEGEEIKSIQLPRSARRGRIRILKTGQIAIGGHFASPKPGEKITDLPKLIQIINREGNLQKEFGKIRDYSDSLLNSFANWYFFDIDDEDNIFISFWFQNRIERYSPEGQLLWKANRILNYDTKPLSKGSSYADEKSAGIQVPEMNIVSNGIAVDGKGQTWVITQNRQLNKNEQGEESNMADVYKLEIFDIDGILLQEIPIQHEAQAIRLRNNQLLLLDHSGVRIFQYEIIEK